MGDCVRSALPPQKSWFAWCVAHMPRSRDRRIHAGGGGSPSGGGRVGGLHGGTGDNVAPAVGVAGGRGVRANGQRLGHLRYSPGEERTVRMSIEKGLRLQRLEQVRQQSRQHAAAVREEYRQRRKENKRAALRESKVCGNLKTFHSRYVIQVLERERAQGFGRSAPMRSLLAFLWQHALYSSKCSIGSYICCALGVKGESCVSLIFEKVSNPSNRPSNPLALKHTHSRFSH